MLCELCRVEESHNFRHFIPRTLHSNKWFRKRFTREDIQQGIEVRKSCHYDQEQHEWVVVLKGAARLLFQDDGGILEMRAGDFVNIPAHKRHRVEWTMLDEPTVWLAVHYG